jgi:hypothetical protein
MMTNARTPDEPRNKRQAEPDLDHRYGRIAISAVVAALPYGGDSKTKPSVAPDPRTDRAA